MSKKIKKLLKSFHTHPLKSLTAVYLLCIVCGLLFNLTNGIYTFAGIKSGKYAQKNLSLNDFEIIGGEVVNDMYMINQSDDTQLIYTGDIKNLAISCTFAYDPGEFVCFYNSSADNSFGTHKMEYAGIHGDYYVFSFPHGTKQIRLDTGIFANNSVDFKEIRINNLTTAEIFAFSTGEIFSLLVLPAVIYMILDTSGQVLVKITERKEK